MYPAAQLVMAVAEVHVKAPVGQAVQVEVPKNPSKH
jgi:hypothetical protein